MDKPNICTATPREIADYLLWYYFDQGNPNGWSREYKACEYYEPTTCGRCFIGALIPDDRIHEKRKGRNKWNQMSVTQVFTELNVMSREKMYRALQNIHDTIVNEFTRENVSPRLEGWVSHYTEDTK